MVQRHLAAKIVTPFFRLVEWLSRCYLARGPCDNDEVLMRGADRQCSGLKVAQSVGEDKEEEEERGSLLFSSLHFDLSAVVGFIGTWLQINTTCSAAFIHNPAAAALPLPSGCSSSRGRLGYHGNKGQGWRNVFPI